MATSHPHLDAYLATKSVANTQAGGDVTLTGTLSASALHDLVGAAEVTGYQLQIVAGVPKLVRKGF